MLTKELTEKLSKVKLFAMDVDGTMTDSGMYYNSEGEYFKRFDAKDGMGIVLLQKSGIECAIITHSVSPVIKKRAEKLNIRHFISGTNNKTEAMNKLATSLNISLDEIAYIGDDVNDKYALEMVGFSACPSDAVQYIKNMVNYICQAKGGAGAIREVAEHILKAQNKPNYVNENW